MLSAAALDITASMNESLGFKRFHTHALSILVLIAGLGALQAAAPLKVLLITGGCCHDYDGQKDILKEGLEARAHVRVDQVHTSDKSTRPPLAILGNAEYADGYDLVIHDECGSDLSKESDVRAVLKPHLDGVPGVNLHCAMHSYRIGNPRTPVTFGTPHGLWFEYLGVQSSGHGPHEPVTVTFTDSASPITRGFTEWLTGKEELYNNVAVFDSAKPLASGKQVVKRRNGEERVAEAVVIWTNEYGPKKAKVFSMTLGHYSETVGDSRYLDLVTRGVLWATGHMSAEATPDAAYGPGGK